MKYFSLIALTLLTLPLHGTDSVWNSFRERVLQFQTQIPGWCSIEKAEKMMQLIYDTRPNICVEIGVFGGSSIYPTARALQYLKKGVVYAIDPWSREECLEGYTPEDPNYQWWASIDLSEVFQNFGLMLKRYKLTNYCHVMRMSSKQALPHFADNSIDILHIDGNHTEAPSLADVQMFVPKIKKGGYLWLDDANWTSMNKAVEYLMLSEQFAVDYERSTNACLLFQKI